MKKLLISTFLILFLISCGGKQTTQMKVSLGAVTGSTNFPGGLVIKGESLAGEKFSLKVPSNDKLIIEVPNGTWNFVALGWDGTEIFEGKSYCDVKTNVLLDGGDFNLNLLATTTNCNHPVFGNIADSNGSFLPLRFNSCMGIKKYIADGDVDEGIADVECNGYDGAPLPGDALSVKISMLDFALGQQAQAGQLGLSSQCYNLSEAQIDTNIKLPYGTSDVVMPYVIQAYPAQNCAGAPEKFLFPNGLSRPTPLNTGVAVVDSSNNKSVVLLHTDSCTGSMLTKTPFANGDPSTGTTRLICNKTHWEKINAEADNGESYQIGADINFGGSNTTIATTFKGSIHGMSYTLSNGDSPLFSTISSQENERTSLRNIEIDSFQIKIEDLGAVTQYDLGIIAKKVQSSGNASAEGVEFDRIIIKNSVIDFDDDSEANIGGMVGYIDLASTVPATNSHDYFSFRANMIDIDISSSSEDPDMSIGGIVGKVTHKQDSSGGVYFEFNSVGSKDKSTNPATINRVTLAASKGSVGGFVGSMKNAEIRRGNVAYLDITSTENTGGFVGKLSGNSSDWARIQSSSADVKYFAHATDSDAIGGIVGYVEDIDIDIDGTIGWLQIPNANKNYEVHDVGGIVGYAGYGATPNFEIKNSKGVVISVADGSNFGGIIGQFNNSGSISASTEPNIFSSVAVANIKEENSAPDQDPGNADNKFRGGIVGKAINLKSKFVIATILDVSGHSYLGGGYGQSDGSVLQESFIDGSKVVASSDSEAWMGGLIGHVKKANVNDFKDNKVVIDNLKAAGYDGSDCQTEGYCGKLVGNQEESNNNSVFNRNLVKVSLKNASDTSQTTLCGGDNCDEGQSEPISNTQQDETETACDNLGAPFDMSPGFDSICEPIFVTSWKAYGFDTVDGEPNFKSGGLAEPFIIDSPAKWNQIGDDLLLMNKTFKLTNNINFQNGNFNPIGSAQLAGNKFKGRIIPDGKKLLNINYDTDDHDDDYETAGGLFPIVKNARIGHWDDPLIIENLSLTATISNVGVIGRLDGYNNEIMIQVKNAAIKGESEATNAIGGLIGYINYGASARIQQSCFQGEIDAQSATGVGGFVGDVSSGANLSIENSFVNLDKLIGNQSVGGMVGKYQGSGYDNINIRESYVWIDKDGNQNGTSSDLEATRQTELNAAGLIGDASGASNINIEQTYVDILNANVDDTYFKSLIGGENFSANVVTGNVVLVNTNTDVDDNDISGVTDYISHQNMIDNVGDFETGDSGHDWAKDANGNLVLGWEIYGFNNY